MMESRFMETNGITLHFLDHPGEGPTLILLPGLTANAHVFGGLVDAGLTPALHVLALDLRGRGLSDHPDSGYTIPDHAADVVGLMDALELDDVVIGGHSFGGFVTYYLAATFPDRFTKAVVIDAPAEADPAVIEQIKPSLARLGTPVPSWDAYIGAVRAQPYFGDWWDPKVEEYYRADVRDNPDGTVQSRSSAENIAAAMDGTLHIDWPQIARSITLPTLSIRAIEPYGPPGSPPIMPRDKAERVAAWLRDGRAAEVEGNHLTMLFGDKAVAVANLIVDFVIE